MALLKKRKTKAFTLAETVVVTCIVAFFAIIPPLYLKGYQESVDLLNAKRMFCTAVNAAARQATLTNRIKKINYSSSQNQIVVSDDNYGSKKYQISKNITISGFPINISREGNISPKTITISNSRAKTSIRIQMMWGKMIDD